MIIIHKVIMVREYTKQYFYSLKSYTVFLEQDEISVLAAWCSYEMAHHKI